MCSLPLPPHTLSASWCYHVCHAPCLYTEINTHTVVPLNLHTHTATFLPLLHLPPCTTHTLKVGLDSAAFHGRIQREARPNKAARIAALATRCNVRLAARKLPLQARRRVMWLTECHLGRLLYIYFLFFPDFPLGSEGRGSVGEGGEAAGGRRGEGGEEERGEEEGRKAGWVIAGFWEEFCV